MDRIAPVRSGEAVVVDRVRGVLAVVTALLAAAAIAVGCATASAASASSGSPAAAAPARPPAVALQPSDGASEVSPTAPLAVSTADATLRDVVLAGPDGRPVAGAVSPDGHQWHASEPLGYGRTYTWRGQASGAGGTVPVAGSFRTVAPATTLDATFTQADNATVGVAAPIILQFDGKVADKAAAEHALSVRTSVPTEGAWAWLPDDGQGSRVHWRPKDYWKPGTVVDVSARLYGVDLGGGRYGQQDVTSHMTIGRSQIVKADVNSHRMVVLRDGRQVMELDASYGLGSDPNRNTRGGTHIVMDKQQTVLMSNPAYGYVNEPEHWAVRISNNGEFIHANPASVGAQGSRNITHGCVNLSDADAQRYFGTALYGDPVEVTNSPIQLSGADGDVYDWATSWEQWKGMSALT